MKGIFESHTRLSTQSQRPSRGETAPLHTNTHTGGARGGGGTGSKRRLTKAQKTLVKRAAQILHSSYLMLRYHAYVFGLMHVGLVAFPACSPHSHSQNSENALMLFMRGGSALPRPSTQSYNHSLTRHLNTALRAVTRNTAY